MVDCESLVKVLYCSFQVLPSRTGFGVRAETFLRNMASRTELDAVTIKLNHLTHVDRFQGARLLRIPVGSGPLPAQTYAFERALRRHMEAADYRLVHFTDPFCGFCLCELRASLGYRLIYEIHGFPSIELRQTHHGLEEKFLTKLRKQELFCLMNADAVVVGSEQTASLVHSWGVSRKQITLAPSSVYPDVFFEKILEKPSRTPMTILYLGNQNAWQGISTLLSALTISTQFAPMRLILAGERNPIEKEDLKNMVADYRLERLVEYVDLTESTDMIALLSSADVGVAPLDNSERNRLQGAPLGKIAFYLAAGRPVLASDLPMVREIADSECILFHSPEDENELAEKLVGLARNPSLRVAMGANARRLADKKFSTEQIQAVWKEIYGSVLGILTDMGENTSISDSELTIPERPSFQYFTGGAELPSENSLELSDEWLGHVLFGYSPLKKPFTC